MDRRLGRGFSRRPRYYTEPTFSDDDSMCDTDDDIPLSWRKGNRSRRTPFGGLRGRRGNGAQTMMSGRGYGTFSPYNIEEDPYPKDMPAGIFDGIQGNHNNNNQIRPYGNTTQPSGNTNQQELHHHHHHYVYNCNTQTAPTDSVPRQLPCRGGQMPMLDYPRNGAMIRRPGLMGPMHGAGRLQPQPQQQEPGFYLPGGPGGGGGRCECCLATQCHALGQQLGAQGPCMPLRPGRMLGV